MKKRYYIKQKLIGLGLLLMAALFIIIDYAGVAVFVIPVALLFIFEKRIILADYYLEKERSKRAD